MARCRLVQPEEIRLPLSDGDFLDVRRELTFGEHRAMLAGQMKLSPAGTEYVRDLDKIGITIVLAYVLRWSLVDFEGRPLPFTEATLRSLEPATVRSRRRRLARRPKMTTWISSRTRSLRRMRSMHRAETGISGCTSRTPSRVQRVEAPFSCQFRSPLLRPGRTVCSSTCGVNGAPAGASR